MLINWYFGMCKYLHATFRICVIVLFGVKEKGKKESFAFFVAYEEI